MILSLVSGNKGGVGKTTIAMAMVFGVIEGVLPYRTITVVDLDGQLTQLVQHDISSVDLRMKSYFAKRLKCGVLEMVEDGMSPVDCVIPMDVEGAVGRKIYIVPPYAPLEGGRSIMRVMGERELAMRFGELLSCISHATSDEDLVVVDCPTMDFGLPGALQLLEHTKPIVVFNEDPDAMLAVHSSFERYRSYAMAAVLNKAGRRAKEAIRELRERRYLAVAIPFFKTREGSIRSVALKIAKDKVKRGWDKVFTPTGRDVPLRVRHWVELIRELAVRIRK